jgi:hypothetical protein
MTVSGEYEGEVDTTQSATRRNCGSKGHELESR